MQVAFYGLLLNTSIILPAIGYGTFGQPLITNTQDIYTKLYDICAGNLIISAAGVLPGYYASIAFIDSWGRKRIQIMGFVVLTVILGTLGLWSFILCCQCNLLSFGMDRFRI